MFVRRVAPRGYSYIVSISECVKCKGWYDSVVYIILTQLQVQASKQ